MMSRTTKDTDGSSSKLTASSVPAASDGHEGVLSSTAPVNQSNRKVEAAATSDVSDTTKQEASAASKIQARYREHAERRSKQGMLLFKRPSQAWYAAVDALMGKSPERQRWEHVTHDAAVVGKGNADMGSLMLKKEHWLEATDKKHRYGSNLEPYHQAWAASATVQPFFMWLDHGDGAALELPEVPREKLERQRLHYLSKPERQRVAAQVGSDGKLRFSSSGSLVHTLSAEEEATLERDPAEWRRHEQEIAALSRGHAAGVSKEEHKAAKAERNRNKWIFVASSDLKLFYIAPKEKGVFGHSSFLAGGAVGAAGQIAVQRGAIVKLSPMSGHYVPTLQHYLAFLGSLSQRGVDLSKALLLNPFEEQQLPPDCPYDLQQASLEALDDKERPAK